MNNRKTKRAIYWSATGLLAFGMLLGGFGQLVRAQFNIDGMIHLGYPLYILTIIGIWKITGVIALLIPKFLLIKEWAYAGFFFVLSGATLSHLISGDGITGSLAPFIFTCLTVVSWLYRPDNRKLINMKSTLHTTI